jgi:hypothetical protein
MLVQFIESSPGRDFLFVPGKLYLVVGMDSECYRIVDFDNDDHASATLFKRSSFTPSDLKPPEEWIIRRDGESYESYMPEVGGKKLIMAMYDGDLPSITAARKEFKERAEKVFAELMRTGGDQDER